MELCCKHLTAGAELDQELQGPGLYFLAITTLYNLRRKEINVSRDYSLRLHRPLSCWCKPKFWVSVGQGEPGCGMPCGSDAHQQPLVQMQIDQIAAAGYGQIPASVTYLAQNCVLIFHKSMGLWLGVLAPSGSSAQSQYISST